MSKLIDLSVFEEETLDIKTTKGNVINIKKPTKELAIKMISYQFKIQQLGNRKDYTEEELLKLMNHLEDLTIEILNNNKGNIAIDKEFIKNNDINYNMQTAILQGYTDFMNEIIENPNSKSPQSKGKKK